MPIPTDRRRGRGGGPGPTRPVPYAASTPCPAPPTSDASANRSPPADRDDEDYLRDGATTREDLASLAPKVTAQVSDAVARRRPHPRRRPRSVVVRRLPAATPDPARPGEARTRGTPLTKRKPYFTEMLTYLATRPHGATPASSPTPSTSPGQGPRLHPDPARLARHEPPHRRQAPPRRPEGPRRPARGVGVYQVRTSSSTPTSSAASASAERHADADGIEDLDAALDLVQGPPFSSLKCATGLDWLVDGDRLDQHLLAPSSTSPTSSPPTPADRRPSRRPAPPRRPPLLAAPDEEVPRLDLAAVGHAEGRRGECAASCATKSSTAPTTTAHHQTSPPAPRTSPTNMAGARATRQSVSSGPRGWGQRSISQPGCSRGHQAE